MCLLIRRAGMHGFWSVLMNRLTAQLAAAMTLALPILAAGQAIVAPIFVTGTRTASTVDAQTRDVTLISADDIARSSARSVADLLASAPGVQIVTNGNAGATSGVFLRGASTTQTLILVDGQRLTSSTSGQTALEALSLANIERIEIVRGPMSALYGADAIGGVIHIFTRSQAGIAASLGAGSQGGLDSSARAGWQSGSWSGNIAAAHARSEGFNAITNTKNFSYNPDRDGYERSGINGRVAYQIAPQVSAFLRALHNDLNTQYDGSAGFDDRARTKQTAWQSGVDFARTQLRIGQAQDRATFESEYPGFYRTRTTEASAQYQLTINNTLDALGLVEYRREQVSASDAFDRTSRKTVSAVVRLGYQSEGVQANATARLDDSDQFGARVTGSAGFSLQIAPQVRVVGNVGSAFKAPTFNDLYYPGFSNAALKPERAFNGDIGLRISFEKAQLSATAYSGRVRDLIVFQCDASFNCAPQNVATAKLEGLTLSATLPISTATQLTASLDAQTAKDVNTNLVLPRRASLHGALGLQYLIGAATIRVNLIASDHRFDDAANKKRLAGYAQIDLGADYALAPGLRAELRLRNVNDAQYQLAGDFATAGRQIFAGFRWEQR